MLNLFKKLKKVAAAHSNEYPAVVKEIHTSFMSAGEKLLKEAKDIIANAEVKDEEKVNRLKKVGFTNAGQVKSAEMAIEKKKQAEKDAAIVEMYAIRYPQYKFITEDIVKQICDKYKLVMGAIGKYKGFVPEKNLSDIESFSVKNEDCHESHHHSRGYMDLSSIANMQMQDRPFLGDLAAVDRRQRDLADLYYQERVLRDMVQEFRPTYPPPIQVAVSEPKITTTYKREFLICAPQKDMKIESWERVEGHKIVHVPDPVVLHPVKHGYLIVTAWGDESSDELVVNQTNN